MIYPPVLTPDFSTPAARRVIRADASRETWLKARTTGIGASEASALLGLSDYGDPYTVWAEKTGRAKPFKGNDRTKWGAKLEPMIRRDFIEASGYRVRASGLLRSREHAFMLYTPDGIVEDGGLLEIKTLSRNVSDEWDNDGVPLHAYSQVQQGLAVTGRSHAWIVGLNLDTLETMTRRVDRDEELIAVLVDVERDLWECVELDKEPPVGPASKPQIAYRWPVARNPLNLHASADAEKLIEVRALVAARDLANKAVEDAEKLKDTADAALARFVEDHDEVNEVADEGKPQRILTYKNISRFSTTRFAADEPDEVVQKYAVRSRRFNPEAIKNLPYLAAATEAVVDEDKLERLIIADRREALSVIDGAEEISDDEILAEFATIEYKGVDTDKLQAEDPELYTKYRGRQFKITKPKTK